MNDHKIEQKFTYEGLGFPVILYNAPMIKLRGKWALNVNMNQLQLAVLLTLAHHPFDLTGDNIQFIRSWLELNHEKFGALFGVTRPAVIKWEKSQGKSSKISVSTQREIRLYILDRILKNDNEFRNAYREIQTIEFLRKNAPIELDSPTNLVAIGQ